MMTPSTLLPVPQGCLLNTAQGPLHEEVYVITNHSLKRWVKAQGDSTQAGQNLPWQWGFSRGSVCIMPSEQWPQGAQGSLPVFCLLHLKFFPHVAIPAWPVPAVSSQAAGPSQDAAQVLHQPRPHVPAVQPAPSLWLFPLPFGSIFCPGLRHPLLCSSRALASVHRYLPPGLVALISSVPWRQACFTGFWRASFSTEGSTRRGLQGVRLWNCTW